MKLTSFSDYTLRVLIYLAIHSNRLVTIAEVAQHYAISENHLMKVVHHLARNDLIQSVRGKGGGIRLARLPEDVRLGDVIRVSEGEVAIVECMDPLTNECRIADCCRLAKILADEFSVLYTRLDCYSLADLVVNQNELMSLLDAPVTEK